MAVGGSAPPSITRPGRAGGPRAGRNRRESAGNHSDSESGGWKRFA